MINKDPIYKQLNQLLKEKIELDEFRVGERFPTEREVSKLYEVSRATANKAISNLVAEGILDFRKGVGTFVKSRPQAEPAEPIISFTENVIKAGRTPGTKVLRFECIPASRAEKGVAASLGVEDSKELYLIERLRLADDIPMILENRYIVADLCPGLSEDAVGGSLFALLQKKYQLHIIGSDETIHATVIGKRESQILAIDEGLAAFRVTSVGYIEGNVPLWWEQTIHRPDGLEFRCHVRSQDRGRRLQERIFLPIDW